MGLLVTPVNIQINENAFVTVHNKNEAYFYSSNMLRIASDCANLVNTTKNPKVFFERYNLLINKLENLEKLWLFVYSWGEIFEKVIRFIKLKKDCKKMGNKV